MVGMTTVLYRSRRLEGLMPETVLPRTRSPLTIALPFIDKVLMWWMKESLRSRWKPSQRMEVGAGMVILSP